MDELTAALAIDLDAAFPRLVEGHVDRLYTIALRVVGSEQDAQELASDALVRAYRALEGYQADRIRALDLRPWLATIVLNVSRNRIRRRRLDISLEAASKDGRDITRSIRPGSQTHDPGPEAVALERERIARLQLALSSLPLRYREPVVLRHIDGCTYAEMTAALGRPEGTLKAQVHRGLALLRAALEDGDTTDIRPTTARTMAKEERT